MSTDFIPDMLLLDLVKSALSEDLGGIGDVTSCAVIAPDTQYSAQLNARQSGVLSGMQIARIAFQLVDPDLHITIHKHDGQMVSSGDTCMTIKGNARAILMAERVALNFCGRLSGIATMTQAYVNETKGTKAKITCTRKTTPGLRLVEKQAVRHGGGANHRFGLNDAIMIKDNHILAAGGISCALDRAVSFASHMTVIEIEVDNLEQLSEVLAHQGAHIVLLDNMSTSDLCKAVDMIAGRLTIEASGNMTLSRVSQVAITGVDYISVGALTHSIVNFDLGLDF